MDHNMNSRTKKPRSQQTFREILQTVAVIKAQRLHRARQNHGHVQRRKRVLDEQAALDHRVRAMRDYDRKFLRKQFRQFVHQDRPVRGGHLQAVLVHQRYNLHFAVRQAQLLQILADLARGVQHHAQLLVVLLLDRPASRNQIDGLHKLFNTR